MALRSEKNLLVFILVERCGFCIRIDAANYSREFSCFNHIWNIQQFWYSFLDSLLLLKVMLVLKYFRETYIKVTYLVNWINEPELYSNCICLLLYRIWSSFEILLSIDFVGNGQNSGDFFSSFFHRAFPGGRHSVK